MLELTVVPIQVSQGVLNVSIPTIRVINDQAPEPLHISLFKCCLFAVGLAAIGLIVLASGVSAVADVSPIIAVKVQSMRDASYEAGILSDLLSFLRNAWDALWVCVRILMWVTIAAVGTFFVLALMAGAGILAWISKQAAKAFIWMVGLVKSAWSPSDPVAVVAGKQWTTKEMIQDLDERVSTLEKGVSDEQISTGQ